MNKRQRKKYARRNRFGHLKNEFRNWIDGKIKLKITSVFADGSRTVRYETLAEHMATLAEHMPNRPQTKWT